jgi:hypothetical protein
MAQILHPKRYAFFTPSVSQMFVLAHAKKWPRQPVDFDLLNFMDDVNKNHFTWPANLYSAGHAHLDPQKSDEREPMIQGRNRSNSVLIGDSGGFQAATGVLDFDWKNPLSEKSINQRLELMRWLEHTADYSMVLDWPAWAIDTGRLPATLMHFDPTTDPLTPSTDEFQNCLKGTVWNNHFFINNRTPGKTKFLNVLQGRSDKEADEWYDAVTPFSNTDIHGERAFEGWALGGATGGDPSLTMRLLVRLRRDGYLSGPDRWIHVLGRSRLSTAAYLAALNESLSRNLNDGIQISYDASSAFLYAVNGNYVTDYAVSPKGLNLISAEFPMDARYIDGVLTEDENGNQVAHGALPFLYNGVSSERMADPNHKKSNVSAKLKMSDFILAPIEGKTKKAYRMDTASYYYIMAHNVEMQAHAVEYVCDKLFAPDAADHIPSIFLEFKDFVNRLFYTDGKAWDSLSDAEKDDYTAKSLKLVEQEASKYSDLISGERPGESMFFEFFEKPTISLEDLSDILDARSRKKIPKEIKVDPTPVEWNQIGIFG